jgi:hypothetical protein
MHAVSLGCPPDFILVLDGVEPLRETGHRHSADDHQIREQRDHYRKTERHQ